MSSPSHGEIRRIWQEMRSCTSLSESLTLPCHLHLPCHLASSHTGARPFCPDPPCARSECLEVLLNAHTRGRATDRGPCHHGRCLACPWCHSGPLAPWTCQVSRPFSTVTRESVGGRCHRASLSPTPLNLLPWPQRTPSRRGETGQGPIPEGIGQRCEGLRDTGRQGQGRRT